MNITLDNILLGEEVFVKKVNGEDILRRRFLDLGILPNTIVKCVLVSPFKDPKAYKINDTVIAIRNSDARNIEVSYERN